ncbi:ecdysone oxidase-like [Anticarsia gemmatalis]|uniref:ecdysone oxidase-like n=1 Tax=Anticarsia gemmatalis TaxID=129554 RepID=UPI003F7582EA
MGTGTSTAAIQALQIPFTLLTTLGIDGGDFLWPAQTQLRNNTAYDYLVVGGGSAGCVVATRLAEDQRNSVLMLEYGGNPPITAVLPGLFSTLPKTPVDYNYKSTYDPYAARSEGNYTSMTAGKMLGGSDSLNYLAHTRGCPTDFDDWADITGDPSWKYENVLKYFIKSERLEDDEILRKYPQYHGTKGPMGLSRQTTNKAKKILESFAATGHPTVLDLNYPETSNGYSQPQYMIAENKRQTPALSYLSRVKDFPNFHVSKNTKVTKILFNGNRAVGIQAVYKRKTYTFWANKEVILSAGVFSTPQILMLSGVGPKDHLQSKGIEVIADLPVGDSFTDHVATSLVYRMQKYRLPIANPADLIMDPTKISLPLIVGSVAFDKEATCPVYQAYCLLFPHDSPALALSCQNSFGYREDICNRFQKQAAGSEVLYAFLSNLVPKSKGTIRLNTTNPFDNPIIATGYLTDSEDLDTLVQMVEDHIQVLDTPYFRQLGAKVIGLDLPECANKRQGSREFWRCYVENMVTSSYHYTGTCSMGTVVDSNLKVKGLERLRVIDASVIPNGGPKGAPSAAVIIFLDYSWLSQKPNSTTTTDPPSILTLQEVKGTTRH